MNRVAWFGLVFLALTPAASAQEPKPKEVKAPKWSVLGLRVSEKEFRDGTMVTAVIQVENHFLVDVDQRKCRISISDDKGTDLLETPTQYRRFIIQEPQVSQDGQYAGMQFFAPGFPAKSATKIRIKGTVVVVVGKNEKQIEKKGVSLQESLDLGIGRLEKANVGLLGGMLDFKGSRPLKSVVVILPDGKEYRYQKTLAGPRSVDGRDDEFRLNLHSFPGKRLTDARLRVTYFENVERLSAPIDLEVGIGF